MFHMLIYCWAVCVYVHVVLEVESRTFTCLVGTSPSLCPHPRLCCLSQNSNPLYFGENGPH